MNFGLNFGLRLKFEMLDPGILSDLSLARWCKYADIFVYVQYEQATTIGLCLYNYLKPATHCPCAATTSENIFCIFCHGNQLPGCPTATPTSHTTEWLPAAQMPATWFMAAGRLAVWPPGRHIQINDVISLSQYEPIPRYTHNFVEERGYLA